MTFRKIMIGVIILVGIAAVAGAAQLGPNPFTIKCTVLDCNGFYNGNTTVWLLGAHATKEYWIKPSWLTSGMPSDHRVSVEGAGNWKPHLLKGFGNNRQFTVYGLKNNNVLHSFTLNVWEDDGDGVFEPGPGGDDPYSAYSIGTLTN